jgi:plastocyanin
MSPGRDAFCTGASRPALLVAAVIVLITSGACGKAAQPGSTAPPTSAVVASATASPEAPPPAAATSAPTTADSGTITIDQFLFSPATITVPAGATVRVDNQDGANHTVTALDASFDTGNIPGKSMGTFVAPRTPGTYPYKCAVHPFMTGTLTVT